MATELARLIQAGERPVVSRGTVRAAATELARLRPPAAGPEAITVDARNAGGRRPGSPRAVLGLLIDLRI